MKPLKKYIGYFCFCFGLFISPCCTNSIEAKQIIVVIDAGHGGHDPGAIGSFSKEKNINLNVALKLGKQIERECSDVKVIYTRKQDVFIPLGRRAEIANDAKADLFISIHTNSVENNSHVCGASIWTLGLAKSAANLEVAKRENSVILYENDYKTRYAGFNPNSAESYIIFEFMQDKYMSQSVHLASLVQNEFHHTCKREDRGVHQAGFLVLKASAMPSILVELGFISNKSEENYLNSDIGITTLANGIFRAFLTYKREQEIKLTGSSQTKKADDYDLVTKEVPDTVEKTQDTVQENQSESKHPVAVQSIQKQNKQEKDNTENKAPIFKIQILTSTRQLGLEDYRLKGLKETEYYKENGLYKYTYASSTNYNIIVRIKREISKQFKDAFIIAFKNGQKMDIHEAINQFKNRK